MSLIEKIGIENVLNSILVNENVRPAMLVQPADYKEATGKDPKTKFIVDAIKERFPDLIVSEDYKTYQGVIISKTNYNDRIDISLERMGEILGYPCYQDFEKIDPDNISYSIDVYVKQKNRQTIQTQTHLFFTNICKDADEIKIKEFKEFADRAKTAFEKEEYKDVLVGFEADKVVVEVNKIVPTQIIINNLIENKTLDDDEVYKIKNILFNFGFSMELQFYFLDNFQYTNPVHKGILLSLLVKEKHDTLTPFFPLQNYPVQSKEVDEITEAWEKDIISLLEKTKIHSIPTPIQPGGKIHKKTKRRRKISRKKQKN